MATQRSRSDRAAVSAAFPKHEEVTVVLEATPEEAFAYLDDFRKLSAHMEKSSMMMMGSRMTIERDAGAGRAIGSKVRMRGKVLGVPLSLEEVVTEREPPYRKAWQTVASNLLVIGRYRLGFQLTRKPLNTECLTFIDYGLPERGLGKWLGLLLGERYARWCVERMAQDAARHFSGMR